MMRLAAVGLCSTEAFGEDATETKPAAEVPAAEGVGRGVSRGPVLAPAVVEVGEALPSSSVPLSSPAFGVSQICVKGAGA
mmetsp:Transcript_26011/g.45296  ORF Transcript_26011/g.45296 Transcript_26011/m.45296 type:complete len:80 (+) Transcript_26011:446-685(+)